MGVNEQYDYDGSGAFVFSNNSSGGGNYSGGFNAFSDNSGGDPGSGFDLDVNLTNIV
jgi:hypothetical protein